MYSIKTITQLTGLTPETLRAWERRYDGILPTRSDNGRRQYSTQDLEKLGLLAELTRDGHAISKIVGLDCDALRKLKLQTSNAGNVLQTLQNQIIDALLEYRIEHCESLLRRALLACEPLDYVRDVLLPILKKIGDLWHEERLSIAQEHMFSSCIKRIVLSLVNQWQNAGSNGPSMLFATPSDEPHEFGILLSCLLATQLHYRCYYLGADVPGEDIVEAARRLQPDVIVIGLTKTPPVASTLQALTKVLAISDSTSALWLGGSGATNLPGLDISGDCVRVDGIDQFYRKAQQLSALKAIDR